MNDHEHAQLRAGTEQVASLFSGCMRDIREQDGILIRDDSLRFLEGDSMLPLSQPSFGRVPVGA